MEKFRTATETFSANYANNAHHQKNFNDELIESLVILISQWVFETQKASITILDLCCGHGEPTAQLLVKLKANGVRIEKIVGYDISPEQIQKANHLAAVHQELSFKVNNIEEMQDNNEFDVIISLFGLHWMNNIEAVAKRIFRAIKPEGRLFFFAPLEKMDLFEAREKLIKEERWTSYFKDFKLCPFIKDSTQYSDAFNRYFMGMDFPVKNGPGEKQKIYSSQELEQFFSSWMQEVRHLIKKQLGDGVQYIQDLIAAMPVESANFSKIYTDVAEAESVTIGSSNLPKKELKIIFQELFFSYFSCPNKIKREGKMAKPNHPFWSVSNSELTHPFAATTIPNEKPELVVNQQQHFSPKI